MKVRSNCFNYRAEIIKDGKKVWNKCYKNMKDMCDDLKEQYSAGTIKCRCSETRRGKIFPNGLHIYKICLPLD
jgi:hypothetical protein